MIKQQFSQNKAGWTKSFIEGTPQDKDGNFLPWMTYPAIEFLQKTINKNHRIFEFGCGASTIFFAKNAKEVVGLETDKRWLEIVKNNLSEKKLNAEIHLMEDGIENENYENFPNNFSEKFDFIIIDSIKRFRCAKNSIKFLKDGGTIILDDSQRENYKKIFEFFEQEGFKKTDFIGIEPGKLKLKNTTIFRK
jgi:predicted O-methyltransferase YrrM